MLSKIAVSILLVATIAFALAILLALVGLTFSLSWLCPIVGGLLVGFAIASVKSATGKCDWCDLISGKYAESRLQLILGLAFILIGRFLV